MFIDFSHTQSFHSVFLHVLSILLYPKVGLHMLCAAPKDDFVELLMNCATIIDGRRGRSYKKHFINTYFMKQFLRSKIIKRLVYKPFFFNSCCEKTRVEF